MTISAEEAVPRSTSTTTGTERLIAPPVAVYTWRARERPSVETIVPSAMKIEATSTASVEQAAAVAAQVEHDPVGAASQQPLDRRVHLRGRALREAREDDDAVASSAHARPRARRRPAA